jgi:hypothetical protein
MSRQYQGGPKSTKEWFYLATVSCIFIGSLPLLIGWMTFDDSYIKAFHANEAIATSM